MYDNGTDSKTQFETDPPRGDAVIVPVGVDVNVVDIPVLLSMMGTEQDKITKDHAHWPGTILACVSAKHLTKQLFWEKNLVQTINYCYSTCYLYTQWADVMTHLFLISVPPQKW